MSDNVANLDWRKPGEGLFPLQHSNFDQTTGTTFDIDMRSHVAAWRIVRRLGTAQSSIGHWQHDPETPGDVCGFFCWNVDRTKRPIPAWFAAIPAVREKAGTPTQGGSNFAPLTNDGMLPLRNEQWSADDRFTLIVNTWPIDNLGRALLPKLPLGFYGIAQNSTEERTQIEKFMPTDPRVISPNFAGDDECGTIIADLDKSSRIDPTRYGREQGWTWIVKQPQSAFVNFFQDRKGNPQNVVAWNIGPSGNSFVRGGAVIDQPLTSNFGDFTSAQPGATPSDRVVGLMSQLQSGPIVVGTQKDKHWIGSDSDKHALMPAHLSTKTFFYQDAAQDGPDLYEYFLLGQDVGIPQQVHKGFDPSSGYQWLGGLASGMWRWWTRSLVYTPTNGTPRPTSPVRLPPNTGGPGGGSKGPGIATDIDGNPLSPGTAPVVPVAYGSDQMPVVHTTQLMAEVRPFAATINETAFPAILGRPQFSVSGRTDLRNWMRPGAANVWDQDHFAPIIGRIEAFAQQGNNNEWTYNQKPGAGKYLSGTASGGFALLPAEIGMEDAPGFAPTGVTLTTPYWMTIPGTYFASGIPNTAYGAPTTGWRWTADASGNELWEQISATAVATNGFRLVPAAGQANMTVGLWDSLGGFWATFQPARLAAARTYTLPDKAGTVGILPVVLTTDISGILPIANGGTNNSLAYSSGSVVFSNGTSLTQDNVNFNYSASKLGLGRTPANDSLETSAAITAFGAVVGAAATSTRIDKSGSNSRFMSWGPNATTKGGLVLVVASSDGSQYNESITCTSLNSVKLGGGTGLATNATDGFLYIPQVGGTPTGVPTSQSNTAPIVFDSVANKLWVYNGAWKGVALT